MTRATNWLDKDDPNYGSWSSWPWCHHCYSMCREGDAGRIVSWLVAVQCWWRGRRG